MYGAGMENGKQVIREQVAARKFVSRELDVAAEHAQAMHDAIKFFMETDFASYLRLGELDIGSLCQICNDTDSEEGHPEGGASHVGPSSTPQLVSLGGMSLQAFQRSYSCVSRDWLFLGWSSSIR
ncbi:unnamed protein product [Lactuca saligna]|uniref:Uncharacterized protein n=1 Tax=Lactuca saligna TaxID=75948 RepID=A0AA35ZHY0_LACSI|nr:unnamed protein product [Lactuca saligna]